jgi:pyridoxamine 5'-phosphate oxidase
VRDGQLIFFTDHRSAKVAHLRANPEATLVFFDPGALLQIRASGKVTLHNQDGVAAQYWATLKPDRQKEYQTVHAPGKHYSEHGSHMNPAFGDRFFMVVAVTINHFDQLQLGRPEHRRIRFCNSRGGWSAERLIP